MGDLAVDILTQKSEIIAGDLVAGRYKIIEQIGQGASAIVYSAHDNTLRRNVALKVLQDKQDIDSDKLKRFKRESTLSAEVSHENIVQIFDIFEENNRPIISMELVQGQTLEEIISKHREDKKPMPQETVVHIITQVLKALVHSHEKDVIHRDIKPSNILVTSDDKVKITDFGIAKKLLRTRVTADSTLTNQATLIGTPQYMSPEQITGSELDGKTDVFSTAAVAYEMLTGSLPFGNTKNSDSMEKIIKITKDPLKLPTKINTNISSKLEDILLKALEKNKKERYSANEFLDAIKAFTDGKIVRVKGSQKRKIGLQKTQSIIALALGITFTGISGFNINNYLNDENQTKQIEQRREEDKRLYEESPASTIDKIQKAKLKVKDVNELKPLFRELNEKIFDRFEWVYRTELQKVKQDQLRVSQPRIFPFGTNNEGKFSYWTGESSTAGFLIPQLYYVSQYFNQRSGNSLKDKEKSKEFINDFFYYASQLFFAKDREKTEENDDNNLVMDRFYYLAKIVMTDFIKDYPEQYVLRAKEIKSIKANYSEAIKMVIEKRYDPKRKFIGKGSGENNLSASGLPDFTKEARITSMLCDGFRLVNLQADVFSQNNYLGSRINSEQDYLDIIFNDADTKIKIFLGNTNLSIKVPKSAQIHTNMILGLSYRINLIKEINDVVLIKPSDTNNLFSQNVSKLTRDYILKLKSKEKYYMEILEKLTQTYLEINGGVTSNYSLDNNEKDNPVDNVATVRFLEAMNQMQRTNPNSKFSDLWLQTIFEINSPRFISSKKQNINFENPYGIVKGATFNRGDSREVTYSETDFLYLKNMLDFISKKN